jgi:hypothetical protein
LSGAALWTSAPSAHAHYGIPRAFSIFFPPGNTDQILLRSDVWGVMHSSDGGKTWFWSCAEAYGRNSGSAEYIPMLLRNGGRAIIGSFDGLTLTDDFCSFTHPKGWPDVPIFDLKSTATGVAALTYHREDAGGYITQILESGDNGETWSVTNGPLPGDFIGSALGFAPSDPKSVYIIGAKPNVAGGVVQRSTDGGKTWAASTFQMDSDHSYASIRVPLVHPTRPDVAFVRLDMPEGFGQDVSDQILATQDGGKTFTVIFTGQGDLPGTALSPDGNTLVIAGPKDGVQSAALSDALTQGQAAFHQIFAGMVWGLNWVSDGSANGLLYAGNNDYTLKGQPAFTFGVSKDGGHTFQQIMNICEVQYPTSCGGSSTMDQACQSLWNTPPAGFAYDFVYGERCIQTDGGADGGHASSGHSSKSSCAFSGPDEESGTSPLVVAGALFGIGALARRRKR